MKMKITKKNGIIAVCFLSIVMLSAITSASFMQFSGVNSDKNLSFSEDTSKIVGYSSVELEAVSYDYLSQRSDVMLTGTVKEILPSKWNTADGKRPHDSAKDFEWHDMIYTDVVVTVDDYLKNPSKEGEVIVRVFAGTVDGDAMIADEEPTFENGEKVFLYLVEDEWEHTKNLGPKHYLVLGSMQGKLTLKGDGTAVRDDNITSFKELSYILEKSR